MEAIGVGAVLFSCVLGWCSTVEGGSGVGSGWAGDRTVVFSSSRGVFVWMILI